MLKLNNLNTFRVILNNLNMMLHQYNFLFYDLETSGLNNSFDQILQFAAIRTDLNFNEIERFNYLVKLNNDTTPSPMATITHKISINKSNSGISEYDAIQKIHKIINTPGTINIGYNNLGFDDEFLKFAFYKNLLPPYNHQFKNNCSIADLFPIVTSYKIFFKQSLKWPIVIDSKGNEKVSLKLEDINKENHLYNQGRAHDAITDVIVTVELAKRLKYVNPKMWDFLLSKFNKKNDRNILSQLNIGLEIENNKYQQAIAISGTFGYKNNFTSAILYLGQHKHYKNKEIFIRLDSYLFSEFIEKFGNLEKEHWRLIINKKWGNIPFILPAKINFVGKLTQEKLDYIKTNKEFIKNNQKIFTKFIDYVLGYKYSDIENIDVDASIYQNSFMNNTDERNCYKFHKSNIYQKIEMLQQFKGTLYNRAVRIIGRLDLNKLSDKSKLEFQTYLKKIFSFNINETLVDHRGKTRKKLGDIYQEIQDLHINNDLTKEQKTLLYELEGYLF